MKFLIKYLTLCSLLYALCFFGCEEKIKPSISNTNYGKNIPTQESWNTRIVFTQSGKIVAILMAGHVAVYEEQQQTYLEGGIQIDFFDTDEYHTSVLTARRGKVNDATRDLEAYENVIVVSDSGTTLRTEKLLWNNSNQKIHTDEFVEIDSPKEKIRGHGLESDQDLKNYKIFRVTGQSAKIE